MSTPTSPWPQPTPYPDVNVALHELRSRIQTILGGQFQGMYLDGSLALGDFSPHSSDIDYVVVTGTDLPEELIAALHTMHAYFNASDSPWATEVEAFYVPQDGLRRYDPDRACFPRIERGLRELLRRCQLDSNWVIHLHVLREHGVVVAGPSTYGLIDPIDPQEIRRAAADLMEVWWGEVSDDSRADLLQGLGGQVYVPLTMCRVLYSLGTGAVASKVAAARWVQQELGDRWPGLIEHALAWRKDRHHPPPAGHLARTLDLIDYTLKRCREWRSRSMRAVS